MHCKTILSSKKNASDTASQNDEIPIVKKEAYDEDIADGEDVPDGDVAYDVIADEVIPKNLELIPGQSDFSFQFTDSSKAIVFLHIGKAGGTSFDTMMKPLKKRVDMRNYYGNAHFDWSYISHYYPNENIVTLLREPVARSISHFVFMQQLSWTKGMAIRSQTYSQFLADRSSMMACRGAWQDGQAAVSWLTGTHIGFGWVKGNRFI